MKVLIISSLSRNLAGYRMKPYNCIRAQAETFRLAKRISVTAVIPVQNGWDCIGSLFPEWKKPAFRPLFQDCYLTPFLGRTGLSGVLQPPIEGGRVENLCSVNKNGVAGARIHGVVNEMRLSLSCYTSDT